MVKVSASLEQTNLFSNPAAVSAANVQDLPKAAAMADLHEQLARKPQAVNSGTSISEIRNGDKILVPQAKGSQYDPVVELLQKHLQQEKFTSDDGRQIVADGKFGLKTAEAISALRKSLNLEAGNQIDKELIDKILPDNIILMRGDRGEQVEVVQKLLGFSKTDQDFGRQTERALKRFEKNNMHNPDVKADGILTTAEMAVLEKKVEGRLKLLGYSEEIKTGGYEAALRGFQERNGIEATGKLNIISLDKIVSQSHALTIGYKQSPIVFRPGSNGEIIRQVNKALIENGYGSGEAGDRFTTETMKMLNRWYQDNGLPDRKGLSLAAIKQLGIAIRPVSEEAIAMVKDFEGCYLKAKLCPGQVLTIGHGHTGNVRWGQTITAGKADSVLREDLEICALSIQNKVKTVLSQQQFDSLVSFTFNLGDSWINEAGLGEAVQAGNFDKAADRMQLYCKAKDKAGNLRELPGLVKRREIESGMLRSDNLVKKDF